MDITYLKELSKNDYWRAVMYASLKESLANENITGDGVEFGGSNRIIQKMFPKIAWETRNFPQYDVTQASAYERSWDVIVTDQVLEHTKEPWEVIRLIGEHTKKIAIITVPFLIGIHPSPHDYWRMTQRTLGELATPYFSSIDVQSWGTSKVNYWHSIYNRTSTLMKNIPEAELTAELLGNNEKKPFVIWAILKK